MAEKFDFKSTDTSQHRPKDGVWSEVREALREQFPNPQRQGCPGPEVLMRLAYRRMPLEEAEPWLDHFSRCSPCFREFEQLQLQARQLRQLRWKLVAGVAVALCSSLALWWTYSHEKAIRARSNQPSQSQPAPQARLAQPPQVSLNFENALSQRDTDQQNSNAPRLPRGPVEISIYLPAGSEPGRYEMELRGSEKASSPQVRFEGAANPEGARMVLKCSPDFSAMEPGTYILALRCNGGRWRYSPVAIS